MNPILRRILPLFLTALTVLLLWPPTAAASEPPAEREYAIKAAFIYNFTKFVQWPGDAGRRMQRQGLTLCTLGDEPFGGTLDRLAGNLKEKGKTIRVIRDVKDREMASCHILFVSRSESGRLSPILDRVRHRPVLVVGDTPGFAERGVAINFFAQKNRVRFEINRQAVERAGLKVGSELLNLARIVTEGTRP